MLSHVSGPREPPGRLPRLASRGATRVDVSETRPPARVLVLGREERAFLTVIRSLGRAGLHVHVGMCAEDDLALRSRYVRAFHHIPAYRPNDTAWIEAVETILRRDAFQIVIPCNDHAVIPVQIHKERLAALTRVVALSDRAFRVAFDKIESHALASALGIPVARSKVMACGEPADRLLEEFDLPIVLKPPSSFTPAALTAKRSVIRVRTREDLENALRASQGWGQLLVEENFIGVGVGVELLAKEGNTLFAFQHVRVHEPLEGGGSSYRRSAPLHPELLAASQALMQALAYTGVAMVEFKFNMQTGRWVFIEINGRFWGSLPLAVAAGADFPRYLYEMLVNGRTEFSPWYRSGIYCRNIRSDVRWLLANVSSDRTDPTLATRPLTSVAGEIFNVLRLRERWDTLALDDPGVGLVEARRALRDVMRTAGRLSRRTLARTRFRRKIAARRLAARMQGARTILFVCKGNICRSPFAERYARKVLPSHLKLLSSGYYPRADREAPPSALLAAQKHGVELQPHRSSVLTADLVAKADLILVFDEQNYDTVLTSYPAARGRVILLAEALDDGPAAIADPYGKDAETFDTVYRQIVTAIERLAAGIGVQRRGAA